ncbi:MAG: co-chaperone GroES [candidate division Zixibacteria bacterium]|nr:co-chaperone GroES [candidate division Zixibacteria bacterium]
MGVKPLGDRVVIKPLDVETEVKKGGIIIPDTAKEKPQQGEIMEVGAGRRTDKGDVVQMEVKKGDRVLYGKYSGTEVTIDNDEFLIMREGDILAVVS